MLDSPDGVCAGQAGFEYPATSVPFSKCSPERGPKLTDIAQIIVGLCTDSATSPLSTCTYALHAAGVKRYRVMPMKAQGSLTTDTAGYQKPSRLVGVP
jgi:hypothetical protein